MMEVNRDSLRAGKPVPSTPIAHAGETISELAKNLLQTLNY